LRERYDRDERLHFVCDNLSTHTTPAVHAWLDDNNARLVLLPTYSSGLNRIEGHFAAIRSFVIAGSTTPTTTRSSTNSSATSTGATTTATTQSYTRPRSEAAFTEGALVAPPRVDLAE
jgi:hypothetical protein